jgi:chromosome segregation ATPase
MRARLEALPTTQIDRIDQLEQRAVMLSRQRDRLAERLAQLPQPRRRFGRDHDQRTVERAHLTSAVHAHDRELQTLELRRPELERDLGDPRELRAERAGLEQAISHTARELGTVLDALVEREVRAPGPRVRAALDEVSDEPTKRQARETAVRQAARYRLEYEVHGSSDALGPRPENHAQRRDWERAHEVLTRGERSVGRGLDTY